MQNVTVQYDPDCIKPLYENGIRIATAIITPDISEDIIIIHPIKFAELNNKGWDV